MKITTVLFDLDGTLLPMDQNRFINAYFGGLAKKLAPFGYEPKQLIDAVWAGTAAMVKNDGKQSNKSVFWDCFVGLLGKRALADAPLLDAFYREDFESIASVCGYTPAAKETVDLLRRNGIRVVLATNPLFPAVATEKRIRWAGLSPADFELYTTYENSYSCKPNPTYYHGILHSLGVEPEACLMVGNDVGEDMIAETLGMKVFLLTDCVINKDGIDLSRYPHGDFLALRAYLNKNILTERSI